VSRARRLAWIAGAAGLAVGMIVIAAVLALPDVAPAPPAGPEGSAGTSPALPPDAAARPRPPGEASGSGIEQAAQLVAAARAEFAAGRLAAARDLLSRAYTLDPQPATLLELASVNLQTGRCREARRAVQRVIADGRGALSSRAQELMGRIGRCD
jgi:tetratricopeptide (TPR) repeat protein